MAKVIIYTRPDGGLSVCVPVISRDDPKDFTAEQALQRALAKDVPANAASVQVVEHTAVPSDRTFRNAWRQTGPTVGCDMPKAVEIWQQKIREARAPILAKLDEEYLRADEVGDNAKKKQIADKKAALRNATEDPRIFTAKTPEELKAVWPEVLKG